MADKVDLPKFEAGKTYVLKGETLNAIITAIKANQILAVQGGSVERTPEGIIIRLS